MDYSFHQSTLQSCGHFTHIISSNSVTVSFRRKTKFYVSFFFGHPVGYNFVSQDNNFLNRREFHQKLLGTIIRVLVRHLYLCSVASNKGRVQKLNKLFLWIFLRRGTPPTPNPSRKIINFFQHFFQFFLLAKNDLHVVKWILYAIGKSSGYSLTPSGEKVWSASW